MIAGTLERNYWASSVWSLSRRKWVKCTNLSSVRRSHLLAVTGLLYGIAYGDSCHHFVIFHAKSLVANHGS